MHLLAPGIKAAQNRIGEFFADKTFQGHTRRVKGFCGESRHVTMQLKVDTCQRFEVPRLEEIIDQLVHIVANSIAGRLINPTIQQVKQDRAELFLNLVTSQRRNKFINLTFVQSMIDCCRSQN